MPSQSAAAQHSPSADSGAAAGGGCVEQLALALLRYSAAREQEDFNQATWTCRICFEEVWHGVMWHAVQGPLRVCVCVCVCTQQRCWLPPSLTRHRLRPTNTPSTTTHATRSPAPPACAWTAVTSTAAAAWPAPRARSCRRASWMPCAAPSLAAAGCARAHRGVLLRAGCVRACAGAPPGGPACRDAGGVCEVLRVERVRMCVSCSPDEPWARVHAHAHGCRWCRPAW
jgi:hypothetical protein